MTSQWICYWCYLSNELNSCIEVNRTMKNRPHSSSVRWWEMHREGDPQMMYNVMYSSIIPPSCPSVAGVDISFFAALEARHDPVTNSGRWGKDVPSISLSPSCWLGYAETWNSHLELEVDTTPAWPGYLWTVKCEDMNMSLVQATFLFSFGVIAPDSIPPTNILQ